jgi:hypothetical protein
MRAKILRLAILASLAINAIALTATASAVEVLLTQFLPEPSAAKPVTFTDSGGLAEFVPLKEKLGGANTLHCEKSTSKGELTTPKLGKDEIKVENCKGFGAVCEDLSKALPKGIVFKGTFHLQTAEEKLVKPEQVPAFVVLPEALHFTCGIVLFLILQSKEDPSCVAGRILEPNTLLKELKVLLIEDPEALGDQNIIKVFNDEDKEYKCTLFFNISEGSLSDLAIHSEEEIKLKEFKQGGKETTALIDF